MARAQVLVLEPGLELLVWVMAQAQVPVLYRQT